MNAAPNNVILMAEDDADDRLLASDAFGEGEPDGELRFVENGEELIDYLQRRGKYADECEAPRPKLIILDLNMPKKDGREVLRELRSEPDLRLIPVVVLTTSRADTDIATTYELGANSFITKPVNYDELVRVMKILKEYWFGTVEVAGPRRPAL